MAKAPTLREAAASASTPRTGAKGNIQPVFASGSLLNSPARARYSKLHFTSAEVNSRPLTGAVLANFTPLRRWKVKVLASGETSQRSASSGRRMRSAKPLDSTPLLNPRTLLKAIPWPEPFGSDFPL